MKIRVTLRQAVLVGLCLPAAGLVMAQPLAPASPPALFGAPLESPPGVAEPAKIVSNFQKLPELQPSRRQVEQPLPPIKVKGRFIMSGREPIALLEVAGQFIQVQKGSELTVAQDLRLRVIDINSAEIHAEVGTSKRVMVLR